MFKQALSISAFGSCRYYPGVDIADEISTESDRIKFLQSVAQVMLTKARMKLNIKKLYAADGNAVKELLKVASLLYKATEKATTNVDEVRGEIAWIWGSVTAVCACTSCMYERLHASFSYHSEVFPSCHLINLVSDALI